MVQKKEEPKNLAMLNIDFVVSERKRLFQEFIDKIQHVPKLLRGASIAAYGQASDDLMKILDKAKTE